MTDIVERLRGIALKDRVDAYSGVREACEEAADEIERLRADLKNMDWEQRRHTIERCAQAVWDAGGDNVEFHVAAIRAHVPWREGKLHLRFDERIKELEISHEKDKP